MLRGVTAPARLPAVNQFRSLLPSMNLQALTAEDLPTPGNPLSALVFRILIDSSARDHASIPAVQSYIWGAIDSLRKADDRSGRIELLERVSQGLHLTRTGADPLQLHGFFAGLTDQWLECATLH
jgi:hypothetical protein